MAPRVLILEDDESLRLVIAKALSRAGFEVRATGSPDAALERLARRDADALVADVLLGRENFLDRLDEVVRVRPDVPIIVMSAQTTAQTALAATQDAVFEYLPKPFDLNILVERLNQALKVEPALRRGPVDRPAGLVGRSPAMQEAFRALGRLAQSDVPVLVVGPAGAGRAAALRLLHDQSGRSGGLLELGPSGFDREGPGVLTDPALGAVVLRRAEAWSEAAQAWVLEALEVGASTAGPRLLATGAEDVADHLPRSLLDRLAIGFVRLPPVRERGDDRALLFESFLDQASGGAMSLSEAAQRRVNAEVWDGEVLEIERVARRIAAQGVRGAVEPTDIEAALAGLARPSPHAALEDAAARYFAARRSAGGEGAIFEDAQVALERGLLSAALAASDGARGEAARLLGVNRNTLARRLSALEIDPPET